MKLVTKSSQHTDKSILAEQIDNLYQFTCDWVDCADMKKGTDCGDCDNSNT